VCRLQQSVDLEAAAAIRNRHRVDLILTPLIGEVGDGKLVVDQHNRDAGIPL